MPYLRDIINDHKAIRNESKEWRIQINMRVNFISFKDTGETRTIYVRSDNEEIRLGNETDDIIKEFFNSFLNNYQEEEIILKKGSGFIFESVDLLSYESYTERKAKHEPSSYLLSLISSFNSKENKHNVYIGRDFVVI